MPLTCGGGLIFTPAAPPAVPTELAALMTPLTPPLAVVLLEAVSAVLAPVEAGRNGLRLPADRVAGMVTLRCGFIAGTFEGCLGRGAWPLGRVFAESGALVETRGDGCGVLEGARWG